MSEQAAESAAANAEAGAAFAPQGDDAFSSLMDTLVGDAESEAAGAAGSEDGGAAGTSGAAAVVAGSEVGGGDAPAAPAGTGAAGAVSGDAAGADGGPAGGGAEQPAAGAGGVPAGWVRPGSELAAEFGKLSTSLEENTSKAYQAQALDAVREEHKPYFEALGKHPRLLVGTQVPAIGKEGTETLRDTNDAREWQEAVKHLLSEEIRDRASRQLDENKGFLANVHQSIELFQKNPDLIPGAKDFNVALANRFAEFAKPYELRVDGKLQGYTIAVQPIIDSFRKEAKTAAPAKASTPAAGAAPAKGEKPQAGVASKAGSSAAVEDFSTLFGTLGLPNLQI